MVPGGGKRSIGVACGLTGLGVAGCCSCCAGAGGAAVGGIESEVGVAGQFGGAWRRARSDRSPSASACSRQAMRLISQVRLLACVASPKSSAKRPGSWATLRPGHSATSLARSGPGGLLGFRESETVPYGQ